jgi:hypothetical protein
MTRFPRSRQQVVALAALIAAMLASGCGSGAESPQTTSEAPTKKVFIERADAMCRKENKQKENLAKKYGEEHHLGPNRPLNKARLEDLLVTLVLPKIREQAENLRHLTAPEGEGKRVEAVAKALEDAVTRAEDEPASVLIPARSPLLKANKAAEVYGFEICAMN